MVRFSTHSCFTVVMSTLTHLVASWLPYSREGSSRFVFSGGSGAHGLGANISL